MTGDRHVDGRARAVAADKVGPSRVGKPASAAWLLVAVLGFVSFGLLTVPVKNQVILPFDQPLLDLARSWSGLEAIWRLLSDSANIPLIVIGIGIVLWLFWQHERRDAILVIFVLAAVTAGSELIKEIVARPRPPGTDTVVPGVVYSFPSGHVLEALTIYGIIAVRNWRSSRPTWFRAGLAALFTVVVLLVAIARVAINAHYPSDVLAGLVGGLGVLGIYAWLTRPKPVIDRA